jgi:polygalacturonase
MSFSSWPKGNKAMHSKIARRRHFDVVIMALAFSGGLGCTAGHEEHYVPSEPIAPLVAPFEMPQLERPTFPNRIFDIRDYGAVADGATSSTAAIAEAVSACADAGGGTVLIPPGLWLTGPIHLKSNVNLHAAEGAIIRFSTRFEDYLPVVLTRWEGVEVLNYSPLIYANGADNIALTGRGTYDGQGEAWFPMRPWQKAEREKLWNSEADGIPVEQRIYGTEEGALRPAMVQPINCSNVLIEGPTFTRSPFWVIHPVYCDRLIIRDIKVNSHGVNNDGVDLDSCSNSLVERCEFVVGDDAVAVKSGRDADGWRVGRPSENIVIRHITSTNGHGGCVIGSELSGGARNIIFHDIYFKDTITAIRIKSKIGRGGVIEDIWFKDIVVTGLRERPAFWLDAFYASHTVQPATETLTKFRNIHVENLASWGGERSVEIGAYPEQPAENVTLENVFATADNGLVLENAVGVTLDGVNIIPHSEKGTDLEPVMKIINSRDVTIIGSRPFVGTNTFLRVEGAGSRNVRLLDNELSHAKTEVQLAEGVSTDAVIRETED